MAIASAVVGLGGTPADVDASNNLLVNLPLDASKAGYVVLAGQHAGATDPSGLIQEDVRVSTQGRLAVGQPVMLLNEVYNYTALNSSIMTAPVTTMTVTCAGGTLNLNAGASAAASGVARVTTYPFYPFQADFATFCTLDMMLTQAPQTNNVVEVGFFQSTGVAAPTDGIFFRYDAAGQLKAVVNNNGTELTSGVLTAPSAGVMHKYKIVGENDRVLFYIDGVCQAVLAAPTTLGMPTYSAYQPWSCRTYNAATPPTLAQVVKIGYTFVGLQDAAGLGKDNATVAAIQGRVGAQGQSGQTRGSTALLTNSLAAGAGVAMTNTTAALGSGLGGQFSTQPTLAVGTDGIVSSYQNPAATAAIPGKQLYIRGIKIQGAVTTTLVGGPVVYEYLLAFGHTNVSLATTESATAKAPRRIALGFESFAAAAAAGAIGQGVYMPFTAPIPVNPGEFVQAVAKNVGVVTTAGVITFTITLDAYWE